MSKQESHTVFDMEEGHFKASDSLFDTQAYILDSNRPVQIDSDTGEILELSDTNCIVSVCGGAITQ